MEKTTTKTIPEKSRDNQKEKTSEKDFIKSHIFFVRPGI
jgi:hypothetical protein